jgi:hypothetical protein
MLEHVRSTNIILMDEISLIDILLIGIVAATATATTTTTVTVVVIINISTVVSHRHFQQRQLKRAEPMTLLGCSFLPPPIKVNMMPYI